MLAHSHFASPPILGEELMTKDEALKMAHKSFMQLNERHPRKDNGNGYFDEEIQACKEALEQPAQEPVAWINVKDKLPPQEINFLSFSETFGYQVSMYSSNPLNSTGLPTLERLKITKWMPIPLYTNPAPSWQGLSDDEISHLKYLHVDYELFDEGEYGTECNVYVDDFARAIEQALKEKNNG